MPTITDWISALANVSMGTSAVAGYFLAKNWKRTATQELAVEHCSNILSDHLRYFEKDATIVSHEELIKALMVRYSKLETVDYQSIKNIASVLKYYKAEMAERTVHYTSIFAEYKRLNHLSWRVVKDKEGIFNELIADWNGINNKGYELIIQMGILFTQFGLPFDCEEPIKHFGIAGNITVETSVIMSEVERLSTEIINTKKGLQEKFNILNINKLTIFELFEAKK